VNLLVHVCFLSPKTRRTATEAHILTLNLPADNRITSCVNSISHLCRLPESKLFIAGRCIWHQHAKDLDKKEKVGDGECVTLIKHFTKAGWTGAWKQGAPAVGNKAMAEGTAIATFANGRWPGLQHGNHAAFYLGQVSDGIYVIDQWKSNAGKPRISKRFLQRLGKDSQGKYIRPTENADAYSVIE
jgi:hypothetical protein